MDLFALATLPTGADEAGRTAVSSSTGYGTTPANISLGQTPGSANCAGVTFLRGERCTLTLSPDGKVALKGT